MGTGGVCVSSGDLGGEEGRRAESSGADLCRGGFRRLSRRRCHM